jgi:NPCBM/NEW2 domain-containing protein
MHSLRPLVTFFIVVTTAGAPGAMANERFAAWLADGTQLTSKSLTAWPLPGSPFRFESHDLAGASNPVRLIRDRHAASTLRPPYVVFANGDRVGAAVVELDDNRGRSGQAARVRLQLEAPLMPVSGPHVCVRTDRVQRIVVSEKAAATQPPPGTVRLNDDRTFVARSVRWRSDGLAILIEDGVREVPFGDLADVVFPSLDQAAAVVEDNVWATTSSPTAIARFQTSSGAVLTTARASREHEQARRRGRLSNAALYYLQPAWAEQALAVPEEDIVCCGYRASDEAPLTLLPATEIANRRLIGSPEPWHVNGAPGGGWPAAGSRESDVGLVAHAYSDIAFALPTTAKTVNLAVGLSRNVGAGGCVRCIVQADQGEMARKLWESGILRGKDGPVAAGPLDVSHARGIHLITEYAHVDRPPGADPLDIRDEVVWLGPLVTLKPPVDSFARPRAMLAGTADWQFRGDDWRDVELGSRWNVPAGAWDAVMALKKGTTLTLTRKLRVTAANDVAELLTVCPADLSEHDFSLTVDGTLVPWHNNADRNQLRQWTLRYSRSRGNQGEEESNLTDRLAYWWDLAPWRGKEVDLELTIRGNRERNEIDWRSLSLRSVVGSTGEERRPQTPDVTLASLVPLRSQDGRASSTASRVTSESVRLLGQEFAAALTLPKNSRVSYSLKPEYKSFIAIVGCPMQVAGPVQVLVDDRVVWERPTIRSLSPAEPLGIDIPAGAKTLTLQSGSEGLYYGTAAFVEAGFVVGQTSSLP